VLQVFKISKVPTKKRLISSTLRILIRHRLINAYYARNAARSWIFDINTLKVLFQSYPLVSYNSNESSTAPYEDL
jgi:hypothetical protein